MQQVVIIPEQEWKEHLLGLAQIRQELAILNMITDEMVWIPAVRVMKMDLQGLKSWEGLNAAHNRGEIVIDKSKKKALISAKSLADWMRKKGYTPEYIKERIAA